VKDLAGQTSATIAYDGSDATTLVAELQRLCLAAKE
jgi:hypothetical protein